MAGVDAFGQVGVDPAAQLPVVHQRAMDPARPATAEQRHEQPERRVFGMVARRRRQRQQHPRHLALAPAQPHHARRPGHRPCACALLGSPGSISLLCLLRWLWLLRLLRARRQPAQKALDRGENGLLARLAGHHQHRVVRPVKAPLKARQLLAAGRSQLAAGAEHRPPVRMTAVEPRLNGDLQGIPGLAVVHGDLFADDLPLAGHLPRVEGQRRDAIGLDRQRLGPAVGGEAEVIGGGIVAGEGVVGAAQRLGPPVDLAGSEPLRALEHHVLEEMGGAAVAGGIVAGAGAEAERRRHHRRLVVLQHADRQAIGEPGELPAPGKAGAAWERRCRGGRGP